MLVGVPTEIKTHEYRIALTPAGARELVQAGHQVLVQQGAGAGSGFTDQEYVAAGAHLKPTARTIFDAADMIVKVKEPLDEECAMLRPGQVLFTYLHLAASAKQTALLMQSGSVAIAYETITDSAGGLPLLAPMSEIAGKLSIQAGAAFLEKARGGSGVLLGGIAGVPPGRVVIIGAGVSGSNAARVAFGMGAEVTVLDRSISKLRGIDEAYDGRIKTLVATPTGIEGAVLHSDIVVGAVLVPGAPAPRVLSRQILPKMRPGSVVVDISIDQGGCFETSRPTTHADPVYVEDGIIHYCVTNMPGAVARSSTIALTNATLPFVLAIADKGWRQALLSDLNLLAGLNVCDGKLTHPGVAHGLSRSTDFVSPELMLAS
ncbi:MAG: alanine dehydrogenase [Rhodospirillales bacterium]|nr:MAG: alanine dehydrogenase [Rhodospirillales bacterium]